MNRYNNLYHVFLASFVPASNAFEGRRSLSVSNTNVVVRLAPGYDGKEGTPAATAAEIPRACTSSPLDPASLDNTHNSTGMMKRVAQMRALDRSLWHTRRHFTRTTSGQHSFPVGSARAWLSDSDVPAERLNLSNARRVVVKVGTTVVSNPDGTLALSRLGALVEEIKALSLSGREVMLVSSGAVGLGRLRLGLSKDVVANPNNVIDRQACAAAGQGILMSTYDTLFQRLNMNCAQVLITQSDFLSRERYSYLTDTLERLMSLGVTPIINENDVVTGCSELDTQRVFSDNDKLSALLAAGADADGLALLTDVEAVFTKPPGDPGAERIKVYDSRASVTIGAQSQMGRGGMASKISAARMSALGGVETVVASGYELNNITKIFSGKDVGTLFPASKRPNKRQRWLSFATSSGGTIRVLNACKVRLTGSGAAQALLTSDILSVAGAFDNRAIVSIEDEDGIEFARGMVQLSASELESMISADGAAASAKPAVHANDFVILEATI